MEKRFQTSYTNNRKSPIGGNKNEEILIIGTSCFNGSWL